MFKVTASVLFAVLAFGTATAPNASADPLHDCTSVVFSTPPWTEPWSVHYCPPGVTG